MELDEWMQTWRIRHYRVVARVIGERVIGTQGTPVEVLGRLIHKVEFPELWDVRNELTARSQAEAVTLREEVTGLLQELLRVNTVNPPGNESPPRSCCATTSRVAASPASSSGAHPSASTSSPACRVATARRWRCSPTPTPFARTRRSGRGIRGRVTSSTARSGAAAHST